MKQITLFIPALPSTFMASETQHQLVQYSTTDRPERIEKRLHEQVRTHVIYFLHAPCSTAAKPWKFIL